MADSANTMFSTEERERLATMATIDFEPVTVPDETEFEQLTQQRLLMYRVACSVVGKSKSDVCNLVESLAGDDLLEEQNHGLEDAIKFFEAAADICETARARMIIAGTSNVVSSE